MKMTTTRGEGRPTVTCVKDELTQIAVYHNPIEKDMPFEVATVAALRRYLAEVRDTQRKLEAEAYLCLLALKAEGVPP